MFFNMSNLKFSTLVRQILVTTVHIVKPGRIVVQSLSFDFFVITFFKGLFLEKEW